MFGLEVKNTRVFSFFFHFFPSLGRFLLGGLLNPTQKIINLISQSNHPSFRGGKERTERKESMKGRGNERRKETERLYHYPLQP